MNDKRSKNFDKRPNCHQRILRRSQDPGKAVDNGTAGILTQSVKALAVNMSRPSGRRWSYASLIGSNNPRWLKVPYRG